MKLRRQKYREAMALMETLASKLPSGIGYDWTGMSYRNGSPATGRLRSMPSR